MDNLVFEVEGAHFSYLGRYPGLCGVDIRISRGEKIALIGANGCGKSTLLHLLDGLIFPDKGSFKAFGRKLKEGWSDSAEFSRDFHKRVGLVFQNPDVQLFCPTVREDIVFGPLQLGLEKEDIRRRLERLCAVLDIGHLLDRPPHQLSIGEKKKAAIASTLIMEPEVLLLDEPTAGLDPQTTRCIMDLFLGDNVRDRTVVTATHDLHIVEEISDKVYVFDREKRIVSSGAPHEVLRDRQLLEDNNLTHIHSHRHLDKVHIHHHLHLEHNGGNNTE